MQVKLGRGLIALIDDEDGPLISQFKWHAIKGWRTFYAQAYIGGGQKNPLLVMMHRFIIDAPDGAQVDHKNNNGLDNRRGNLRICNASQNLGNSRMFLKNRIGFKGVILKRDTFRNRPYRARIWYAGKSLILGHYTTAQDAARAYDEAAMRIHGEFARTNKSMGLLG